eukprot:CAMPEP_0182424364 /NCGR_PEP_ID=MMETSP1167-20130531/10553_1 /TAXON_ID=2988 /ORGANISM="Mallomonas Sp, Strain CCMP3275" /LENGTH=505 /DNA_ID=CAMNT_0024604129 /DNA_START=246 /DNA_END=1763 /DNA_ORIENTATION=+
MSFVVLFAYGYLRDSPDLLKQTRIMQGPYNDYTSKWYTQVGSFLTITFIINSNIPYLWHLPNYLIISPFKRWTSYRQVDKRAQKHLPMQSDVNELEVGPVFVFSANSAFQLAMLFFGMTYAPGVPLLMPLTCFIYCVYFLLDKLLLLRYYRKPPHMSGGVNKIVLSLLPFAAVVRLCNACWMFGNAALIPSSTQNLEFITGVPGEADPQAASSAYTEYLQENQGGVTYEIVSRIVRTNVLPLFIVLSAIIALTVVRLLWKQLPFYWILKAVGYISKRICRTNKIDAVTKSDGYVHGPDLLKLHDPNRTEMAPYTEPYFKYVHKIGERPPFYYAILGLDWRMALTESEIAEGWDNSTKNNYNIKMKRWIKSHAQGSDGYRAKGTVKKTYEVVADNGCPSYQLEKIPEYRMAINGLKEGAKNINSGVTKDVSNIIGSVAARFLDQETQKENNKKLDVLTRRNRATVEALEEASKEKAKRVDLEKGSYRANVRASFRNDLAFLDDDDL